MLSKILVTALVIGAVLLFIKKQNQATRQADPEKSSAESAQSLSPKALTYVVIALLALTSAGLFIFKYQSDNQLLLLTVRDAKGTVTQYVVKKQHLKGREFTTVNGKFVTIGASDRIEIEEK